MYDTTEDWKEHMRKSHSTRLWMCDTCQFHSDEPDEFAFHSEKAWVDHMFSAHEGEFEPGDVVDLAGESQQIRLLPVRCPLCCGDTPLSDPETDKHFAEHLESFALEALPWHMI